MPGIVKPIDQQDHLGTMASLAEYLRGNIFPEKGAMPRSESGRYTFDLNPVEVFDKKKNPHGAIYTEPGVSVNAEIVGPVNAIPGGGVKGTLGKMTAKPWQSRTLDTITGVLPAGKKFPDAATPQTWLSKLKGAGLPKEEVEIAEGFLAAADPKSKLSRQQLTSALDERANSVTSLAEQYGALTKEGNAIKRGDHPDFQGYESSTRAMERLSEIDSRVQQILNTKSLPSLGVTRTELGGPEWAAGQKRLNELPALINKSKQSAKDRIAELYKETGGAVPEEVYRADPKWKESYAQTKDLVTEQMKLSQDAVGKRPHWPQHNIEGAENPREVLYHAKPKSGESEYINSDMETHYGQDKGKNLLFHQREAELTLPDGKKSTHISEQQSDWHAEYTKENKKAVEQQQRVIRALERNDIEFLRGEIPSRFDIDNMSDHAVVGYANRYLAVDKSVPEPPMKDTWHKMGFKDAVKRAVEAGHDYVTWDTADTQIKRWPAGEGAEKYFKKHYDESLVKLAAKEYGVKPERIVLKTDEVAGLSGVSGELVPVHKTNEVWRIPVTEDMKRKILLEGQYFSKRTAKPGGRNAEGIA